MPVPWTTIPLLVDDAAARFGADEAMVDADVRWDFATLRDRVRGAAAALIASGIERGDRVGLWAPNCWEWAVAALGVHVAGGIVVPVNTRFKGREAAQVLEASKTRILFTVTDFLDTDYVALIGDAGIPAALEEIVVLRGTVPETTTAFVDFMARGAAVGDDAVSARAAAVEGDDLCTIMFTSGTTR